MSDSREKLFAATITSVVEKGYAATTVDEICEAAGVTKGAFFHHFPSKQSLTAAAVNDWAEKSDAFDAAAPYHRFDDPLQRFLGYLDFRKAALRAPAASTNCVVGLLIREVYETHPDILRACEEFISGQVARVESDIAGAMEVYGVHPHWTPRSLALHVQSVLQGVHLLAKSGEDIRIAIESIDHLRCYVEMLFRRPEPGRVQRLEQRR